MNNLNRVNNRVYGSDQRQAFASAKANISLMLKYQKAFNYVRSGKRFLADLKSMAKRFKQDNFLTDKQLSYINEAIYEKWWTGLSKANNDPELKGATTKHDNKKTLRH